MRIIKSVFSLLLVIAMIFTLAACGGEGETSTTNPTEASTTVPATEPAPTIVSVGDVTIEFLRAEKYVPFEKGESLLVYCKFTNNSAEETSAYKKLYITAKNGGEFVNEITYMDEYKPEGMNDYAQPVAPGESREIFYTLKYVEGITEVTIQDINNQIPDKLVVKIDSSTL